MVTFIIDSHAWIEYFIGSKRGKVLRLLFEDEHNTFMTVECCLAEIKGWCLKHNQSFNELFTIIRANSKIISVVEKDWIDAADEKCKQRITQKNFGLIDAVILVKQKFYNCKIVSGDHHFQNLKNVVFI